MPDPDRHGWYRVAETVGGHTRHYSTRAFSPSAHRIVPGPASDAAGNPLPPKFQTPEHKGRKAADTKAKEATE